MKKTLVAILALIVLAMPLAALSPTFTSSAAAIDVLSQTCNNPDAPAKPEFCKDNVNNDATLLGPDGILMKVLNILSLIGGVIAIFVIIIGAVKLVASGGDTNSVASSRRAILYALLSLAIIAVAQIAVRFIISLV